MDEEIKQSEEASLTNGAFGASLLRNNSTIKKDRAITIIETAELIYKRKVEDLEVELKMMKRDQDNMLDLSPSHVGTLMVASDFEASPFVEKDLQLGISIRNKEIALEIAIKRYNFLFGGKK